MLQNKLLGRLSRHTHRVELAQPVVDPKREYGDWTVAFVRLRLCELTAPEVVVKDGKLRCNIKSLTL